MALLHMRGFFLLFLIVSVILLTSYSFRASFSYNNVPEVIQVPAEPESEPQPPAASPPETVVPVNAHKYLNRPIYKPVHGVPPPIVDNFPLAASAHSAADLPPIPPWNKPPEPHVKEKTPLFIGFTRNWRLLQQVVVSYITAGWPPEDIYVVENTGTMYSNKKGLLSLQNPFFLNHTRLNLLGVNVVVTPTLQSFSQLQNFFLWTAIQEDYPSYFWAHMDTIALGLEDRYTGSVFKTAKGGPQYTGYKSIYTLAVEALRNTSATPDINSGNPNQTWAMRFFAYDRLALVNREAFEAVGGWDSHIPFYHSDCDMHDRLLMNEFEIGKGDVLIGNFTDVPESFDDLIVLYRKKDTVEAGFTADRSYSTSEKRTETSSPKKEWESDVLGSPMYRKLLDIMGGMNELKNGNQGAQRLDWQTRQTGGKGEPYYRNADGFDKGIKMLTEVGRNIFSEKWGHRECGLLEYGRRKGDEWRVEHDWD